MGNYIDISKQQRVVFVDKIKYDDAKALSKQYPFAMFFTSAEDDVYHTIWRNGFCYSYVSEIDNTPITLDKYSISLSIDRKGKLSLNVGNAISNFELIKYVSEDNDPILYNNGDTITIKNNGELYFELYGNNGEKLSEYNKNGLQIFDFRLYKEGSDDPFENLTETYISGIQSKKDNNFIGIKYIFDVEKQYLNDDLRLEVSYSILGQINLKTYNIKLEKTVEKELIWIGTEDPLIGSYPQEITESGIAESIDSLGWHYLSDLSLDLNRPEPLYDYYGENPLVVEEGNIWVVIPKNRKLCVKLLNDNTIFYVIDYGDETCSYSWQRDCIINNMEYQIFKLNDNGITEFINIIQ